MMKKILLLFISIITVAMAANADGGLTFNWAKLIDSESSDSPKSLTESSDGKVLLMCNFGTASTDALAVWYGDEEIGNGAPYGGGTGTNSNLLIAKVDNDGTLLWSVNSEWGDVATGDCAMAATADGGAVVALKVRHTNRDAAGNGILLSLRDAKDNVVNITWAMPAVWAYQGVLVRIDKDGAIEWSKMIEVDTSAQEAATSASYKLGTPNAFYFYGLTVGDDGNIYLAGNLRKTITMVKADNDAVEIAPLNTGSWNGDSQGSTGDLFIVKLDAAGNYVKHIMSNGISDKDAVNSIAIYGGKLYFAGTVKGKTGAESDFAVGTKTVTPSSFDDILLGCVDLDLNDAEWLSCYTAFGFTDGKHTTQIKKLNVIDGKLYVTGAVKGGFGKDSSEALIASTTASLEGFVVCADLENGNWKSGGIQGSDGITVYYATLVHGGNTYVYGYKLSSSVFVSKFDEAAGTISDKEEIVKGGGAITAWDCIAINDDVYSFSRCNSSPVSTFQGSDFTLASTGWGSILSSFHFVSTGVEHNAVAQSTLVAAGGIGAITITAQEPVQVRIYNASGACVNIVDVAQGSTTVNVAAGFYIVNGIKVIVR